METKLLFFFLLLIVSFSGYSQESKIALAPDKEIDATVALSPYKGNGNSISLPAVLNWNKKTNTLEIQFKGINAANRFIYFFPKESNFEEIKKQDKQIWFSKEIKIRATAVERYIGNLKNNVRWKNEFTDLREFSLSGPAPLRECRFQFDLESPNVNNCRITMKIYVASQENDKKRFLFFQTTSKRDRKIEYMSEVTLDITLQDKCENSGVQSRIESIMKEMEVIQAGTARTKSEAEELSKMNCRIIRGLKNKLPFGNNEKYDIINEQYNECESLKKIIGEYNAAIDTYDNAIYDYNNRLEKRKLQCDTTIDCSSVKSANSQLMELYFQIEKSEKEDLSSFESKYLEIRKKVSDQIHKNCKEYAAFKEWSTAIDKLLKK